ncbi:branched-chain amino acid transport system II carrier protein [Zhouia amylolytica]|uniref:Branched-chain amino acid transport system carrier protein n=1 Tax=Zhouia amylolytica AD3 TaxID=1286632 RepID=W2UJG3_9FLAO|nr:branched-chain amino acid transport system II carrier protein [Zhouia amylolytica]ETN94153.1 branched-chain amino acid transport system carrier protein [Zhouia amylolytica AD3]
MNKTKETLLTAFALFSLFFGAGNLILPPFLGYNSGDQWFLTSIGFSISAVLIPILGIYAHAKIQGTMIDFAKKVSPVFSFVYCSLVYLIAIGLPSPRTASVTHEMAISPYFNVSPLITSTVYFILVFIIVINRSKLIEVIGKFITPLILFILISIMGVSIFSNNSPAANSPYPKPFSSGILEGYQTFDAIGAVVVGAVIIISINIRSNETYIAKRKLISRAGILAGLGLFIIYTGLIFTGALYGPEFSDNVSRTNLLNGIAAKTLGSIGRQFLSILVTLACFTTAVGIVTGTSDYAKQIFNNSKTAFLITAILGCSLGILVGQLNVGYIIDIAIPALAFIYPITIVLIILNAIPAKYTSSVVFKMVVITTILFSIPDFIQTLGLHQDFSLWHQFIPFSEHQLGWTAPALIALIATNIFLKYSDKLKSTS